MSKRQFDRFEFDVETSELSRDGRPVKLPPQPAKLLGLLIERAGQVVRRDEIKRHLWGEDTFVDFERGLNFCALQVRTALRDTVDSPRFLQTVPRRGYRFIAPVTDLSASRVPPVDPEPVSQATPPTPLGVRARRRGAVSPGHLKRIWWVACLTLGTAAACWSLWGARPSASGTEGPLRLAVLPFVNLTGDENADYVVDGLTDEVIAQLGALGRSRLGVIARTSVMTYRNTPKTVAEIGRELNVHYVLEGSVRREGSRVRVNAQLVSTDDEAHMWSGSFERAADETMALQTDVAARVVRALALQLVTEREGVARPPSRSRAAWDAYLQGRYWMNRGRADAVRRAVEHLEWTVTVDPGFAGAWALLAEAKHLQVMIGDVAPGDAYPRAAEAAERAVALAPTLPDSHVAAGVVQLWFEWSPARAQASFERAISLNGSHGVAHHDYAWTLVALSRLEEAVEHIEIARGLDPVSIRSTADVGWLRLHLRQPTEATLACEQALALAPGALEPQACFERAFIQRGLLAEAARAARTMLPADGPVSRGWDESRTAAEKLGAVWRWRLERLEEASRTRWVSPYLLAVHHLLLGDEDAALTKLEEAVERRVSTMVLLRTDPAVDGVRDEPRFHALLERIRPTPP